MNTIEQFNKVEQYNGWTNKPTWLVNMWLSNDETSEQMVREWTEEIYEQAEESEYLSKTDEAIQELEQRLKDFVEDAPTIENGLNADLLQWSLAYVDWKKIATDYIDELLNEIDSQD